MHKLMETSPSGADGARPHAALMQLRADAVRRDDRRAVMLCDALAATGFPSTAPIAPRP